jgi:Helix-turn-helix domain
MNESLPPFIGDHPKARQCLALLTMLRTGPVTTLAAREVLGIGSPAARILDLRKRGYLIQTQRSKDIDYQGRPHTVAMYVLLGGPECQAY